MNYVSILCSSRMFVRNKFPSICEEAFCICIQYTPIFSRTTALCGKHIPQSADWVVIGI